MRGTSKAPPSESKSKFLKRLRTRIGVPAALIAVAVLALPGSASALGLGETKEYFEPTQPTKPLTLAQGPDGNVWYTNDGSTKIGSVTKAGVTAEYSPGLAGNALSIAAGPDGNVWFTEPSAKKIGYIKTSEPATSLQEFSTGATLEPQFITKGPDGNLWFTGATGGGTAAAKMIGRITPAGVVTEFTLGFNASAAPCSIIPGPDGNVWFGDCASTRAIGRIVPSGEKEGEVKEFTVIGSLTSRPNSIAFGSDERIWFAANKSTTEKIGAITTAGAVSYYSTGAITLSGFATGADGNVWAREAATANERQKVVVNDTGVLGGTYKLSFLGEETTSLAYNAAGVVVEEALGALPSIGGVANVKAIEVETLPNSAERTIEFEGKFARTDVPAITCDGSGLTGTTPSCSVDPAATAVPQKLYRFEPSGTAKDFPLAPQTLGVTPTTTGKGGTLVPGPDSSLWFTTAGDPSFVSTPAIAKFGLGINNFTLTVNKEGTGDGTVVSSPSGIECDPTCSAEFKEGQEVTLTASPDSESQFVSWKGCDKLGAIGRQCKVTMTANKTVSAKFTTAYDVSVTRVGSGLGKVGSSPGGVLCLSNCSSTSASFKELTNVTLTATPSKHFTFTEWTGDCSGSGTCSLPSLGADKSVGAKFTEVAKFDLTVTKKGGGNGTVKAKQAGINCGTYCSSMAAAYYSGEVIELLVPTPGKGSTFAGWSGAGCSGTGTCLVTMSSAKSVEAEFK